MESEPIIHEYGQEYEFQWPTHQIVIRFSRLYDSRREGIAGDINVIFTDPQVAIFPIWERFNLSSRRTRVSLANDLDDTYPLGIWRELLEQACGLTAEMMRKGEPVIRIGGRKIPRLSYQLDGLTVQHNPTMIYGDGDTGKSLLALTLSLHIDSGFSFFDHEVLQPSPILYLDYEYDDVAHEERLQGLSPGLGFITIPELLYRRCTYPLADDVRTILRIVKENEIGCVVVDSCAAACGGDPQLPEPVLRFFTALRSLETSSILIHHGTKENKSGPFGSVYWKNYSRLVWQVKSERVEGSNSLQMSLFNEKNNAGPRLKPLGFNFSFQDGQIEVTKGNPRTSSAYYERTSPTTAMEAAIQNLGGKVTVAQLAEELSKPPASIRRLLNDHKDDHFIKLGDQWGIRTQD